MNKMARKIGAGGSRVFCVILLAFAAVSWLVFNQPELAAAETVAAAALFVYYTIAGRRNRQRVLDYIESMTYDAEDAKNNTLLNFPLPIAVYRLDTERIVWGNQGFFGICGYAQPAFDAKITAMVPRYDGRWLVEGKGRCPALVELGGRRYQVHGNIVRGQGEQTSTGSMGITYWIDVTDYDDIKLEYAASRPVVMLIALDNYDELVKNETERARTLLRNQVEDKLAQWLDGKKGLLRRYDRERYICICEKRYFEALEKGKFSILEDVHSIAGTAGIHATLSIGVGFDGASYEEDLKLASLSVDMALSRGGDQAVTRDRVNFTFYGGRGEEVETRTKVRSRVVANAMASSIREASVTYVMGHKYADMDSLGAAVAVCCIARKLGKRARIVMDIQSCNCKPLVEMVRRHKEYADVFISPSDAIVAANSRSLLFVVDTSQPSLVEDEALLQTINRVVLVDHHRRAAAYIDKADLDLYEQYASSACELMTEVMQELLEQSDIQRFEAEAILAGIVMDTKNFTIRTGERTFDAAAFLRRTGAEPTEVKKLLQNDFESTITRYRIMENARVFHDSIAVAVVDEPVPRVVAAQAADELLSINGVDASVVMYPTGDGVDVSARSIGELNVQVLLEKLGGGGNKSAAGAQMKQIGIKQAAEQLYAAIREYLATE